MSSASWPPQLKDWVAKCLGQMTDSNRKEAQDELRQVIADAFAAHTLWTTDWDGVQLKSLLPKPPTLKRKINETPLSSKKSKKDKSGVKQVTTGTASLDLNDQVALNRRAERFQREHEIERQKSLNGSGYGSHTSGSALKANSRNSHLFSNSSRIYSPSRSASPYGNGDDPEADPNVIDWDRYTIVGTSKEIFKDYLRLTSEPKPETIRPYAVLQETLLQLKTRWRERCSYAWICNQFKSLRQDLTVQRIKNEFTVQAYEIHARMALESNDMVEYNSCQATLKSLYELGIPGKVEEFTAYRILMLLHGRNRSELNLYVGQLTPRQKADPAVKHALDVQRSLAMGNYHALFLLYLNAPNMGAYIMDHFIDRERVRAMMVITRVYKIIPLSFLEKELAFDDIDATRAFLESHKSAYFTNPQAADMEKSLDCKSVIPHLAQSYEDKYRRVGIKGAI